MEEKIWGNDLFINNDVNIQEIGKTKHLEAIIDKDGLGKEEIKTKIQNIRLVVSCLNGFWWDRNASTKK